MLEINPIDEILKLLKTDDEKGLQLLMMHYAGKVYGFCKKFVKSPEIAEELTQDVFIQVWKIRKDLNSNSNAEGLIYRIARNYCLNYIKSAASQKRIKTHLYESSTDLSYSPSDQIRAEEFNVYIQEAIEQLSPRRKQIFVMSKMEGLSHKEISVKLGLSVNTIKVNIVKSNKQIREYLLSQGYPQSITNFALLLGFLVNI